MFKDADIGRIIEIVNRSDIAVVRLRTDDFDLVVSKDGSYPGSLDDAAPAGPPAVPAASPGNSQPGGTVHEEDRGPRDAGERKDGETAPPRVEPETELAREKEGSADGSVTVVRAPLLGTFYAAPEPGAPPFVEVGTEVDADTTVGLLEAMKLFTAVRANTGGVVEEILVTNGTLVEYEAPLLTIRESR